MILPQRASKRKEVKTENSRTCCAVYREVDFQEKEKI
jgi:hypothetical protein